MVVRGGTLITGMSICYHGNKLQIGFGIDRTTDWYYYVWHWNIDTDKDDPSDSVKTDIGYDIEDWHVTNVDRTNATWYE